MDTRAILFLALLLCLSTALLAIHGGHKFGPRDDGVVRHLTRRKTLIHYQSQSISFNEWLSQLTLCLAPLATHILTGVPSAAILRGPDPSVANWISHFNPTSIVWRYFAIADRRIRSKAWTSSNMAASNAVFWTGIRWDGSEDIMTRSKAWMTRSPNRTRVPLLSVSVLGTFIVSVQAVYVLSTMALQIKTRSSLMNLEGIFAPLAVASLVRLLPAVWLSDEYGYRCLSDVRGDSIELTESPRGWLRASSELRDGRWEDFMSKDFDKNNMHPQSYWPAVLLRVLYLFVWLCFTAYMVICQITTMGELLSPYPLASTIVDHLLYLFLCLMTFLISLFYITTGKGNTTIMPCIGTSWYTAYTIAWYVGAVVVVVIRGLETRRTPCGVYTTFPREAGLDEGLCSTYVRPS